jgi:hypothetical protein
MQFTLTLLVCFVLTACGVVTSDIVPAGKDTYFMSGRGYAVASGGSFAKVYKEADVFCKKQGKVSTPVSSHAEKIDQMSSSVDLTFRCLFESDPELQRPNMKPIANTSIEIIHK